MKQQNPTVLLVPSVTPGNGTGHLRRCLETAQTLATHSDAAILVPRDRPLLSAVDAILDAFPSVDQRSELQTHDITVLDQRETSRAFVDELRKSTLVVGLDEGGPGRGYCDYLVDTFPTLAGASEPNTTVPAARAPRNRRSFSPAEHASILVTFGGEDPAVLTPATCKSLIDGGVGPRRVTAVRGPSAPVWELPSGVELLENQNDLREILHRYDIIITSFGITAFEALSAGSAVLLVNPTRYHTKLSDDAGFPCAGTGQVDQGRLMAAIDDPVEYSRKMARLRGRLASDGWDPEADGLSLLSDALSGLSTDGSSSCPVCRGTAAQAITRFLDRTYFRCSCTGLLYQRSFSDSPRIYDDEYFFAEYQAQYGKTYLEDFQKIKQMARPRLRMISRMIHGTNSLLDVGCAYGPFLDGARERGFECFGTDIAEDAVDYVSTELGISAVRADFTDIDPETVLGRPRFDVLTMWYVIEHFSDLDEVLRKASELLPVGGVFAFSTPNCRGISARASITDFLEQSPADHFSVWSPWIARRVLKRYGFRVRRVRVTGHHPERFPGSGRGAPGFVRGLINIISRAFRLGDTFEVYSVKTGEPST
jgi:2-polyprenyl-3-methyl-5-hydroxy-6-metoxy-1,4-benzoquinol methylase